MFQVRSTERMVVCVHVSHLAEKCGLELSCGVAGVKKFTKRHLQKKKRKVAKYMNILFKVYCQGNPDCINITYYFWQVLYQILRSFSVKKKTKTTCGQSEREKRVSPVEARSCI